MRRSFRLLVSTVVALGLLAGIAGAQPVADQSSKMTRLFTSPNLATNSDLAFWGDHAFVGYYTGGAGFPPGTGPRGGVRIFDISNPAGPQLVRDFACDGAQNDPIVWDRNGNGVADLMLLAVDTTMAAPQCGAARVAGGTPTGWEGVRVFTMSDDPANPFTNITAGQVRVHGLRRTYDHALARGAGQADRLRLVVPAGGGTHVRRHGVPEHGQPVRRGPR